MTVKKDKFVKLEWEVYEALLAHKKDTGINIQYHVNDTIKKDLSKYMEK